MHGPHPAARSRWIRAIRFLVALAAAGASAGCGGDPTGASLASDDELIAVFHRERAAFDSLARMLDEDRNIEMLDNYGEHVQFLEPRVVEYHDPGASAHGLSAERWNTYERLLRRVGTGRNVWNTADGIVLQQYVAKFGPTDSRWMRGYHYARGRVPARLEETSDLLADSTWSARGRWERPLYRPIEAEWYLYADKGYSD